MNLISTPNIGNLRSPQGRISITIGKIAVGMRVHKAQPCHGSGTEVMGKWPGSALRESKQRVAGSVRLRVPCFSRLTCGRNYDRGQIVFRGQLTEGGKVAALQVIPVAEQLFGLALQLFELQLLRLG